MHRSTRFTAPTLLSAILGCTALGACWLDPPSDGEANAGHAALVPDPADPPAPPSLKTVKVPEPDNLDEVVKDRSAAILLGKALFWDMQIGTDGVQACASCHSHAGADSRSRNQISPGFSKPEIGAPAPRDKTFNVGGGPNYQLKASDFPFHRKVDPSNRDSPASYDANDIVGSQGVTKAAFVDARPGQAEDDRQTVPDPDGFRIGNVNVRRVENRQTPTVINAVFNFRQFWDGRAQNEFNGVNSLGAKDPNAFLFKADASGALTKTHVSFKNSSLASQAMEPPLSSLETSSDGRTFQDIGEKVTGEGSRGRAGHPGGCHPKKSRRLRALRPLARQEVDRDDSVLGAFSRAPRPGLTVDSYDDLVRAAFKPEWWSSSSVVEVDATGAVTVRDAPSHAPNTDAYTLMEYNFSLFFGLAIQMYEATLVADDTPFDRFRAGDANAITPLAQHGIDLFRSQARGRCINCHGGAELTDATVTRHTKNQLRRREGTDILDFGFNNIGVRPTYEDLGIGGTHPLNPNVILSEARLAFLGQFTDPSLSPPIGPTDVLAVDGAFKVPGLRNIELTAPYFHNGGYLTLRQVLDFYSRGGDFHPILAQDGHQIQPLTVFNFTEDEKNAFEAFLLSLTDERVRHQEAPFDHPQIFLPNGHVGDTTKVKANKDGSARDVFIEVPAVGRHGSKPPPNFLER